MPGYLSRFTDNASTEPQSYAQPSCQRRPLPVTAGGTLLAALIAATVGCGGGDTDENSYLPSGLSGNEVAKAFAGIYQYDHVSEERPDGSRDKWSQTIYLIYAPTSERQGVFYQIDDDGVLGRHGHWKFYGCYQDPPGKEYQVRLSRVPTSTYKDAAAELFYQINKDRDVSILADRFIDNNTDRVYHKAGPITDDMLERVEITKSGTVTYKLKKYPDHIADD